MKQAIIFSLAFILLISCQKRHAPDPGTYGVCGVMSSEAANADYFIFGYTGDMYCSYYMIKNGSLYKDTTCFHDTSSFIKQPLPQSKYNNTLVLTYNLPNYISNLPDTTLGCPNCVDQGGWYIEYRVNSKVKKYSIDADTAAIPAGAKNYILMMKAVVDSLK